MARPISKGMWVTDGKRLGITFINSRDPDFPELEVHVVDDAGDTTVITRGWEGWVQAPASMLPAGRVGHMTAQQLATLGYV